MFGHFAGQDGPLFGPEDRGQPHLGLGKSLYGHDHDSAGTRTGEAVVGTGRRGHSGFASRSGRTGFSGLTGRSGLSGFIRSSAFIGRSGPAGLTRFLGFTGFIAFSRAYGPPWSARDAAVAHAAMIRSRAPSSEDGQ